MPADWFLARYSCVDQILKWLAFSHIMMGPVWLPKLKQLKKKYDPASVFSQWFTIKP